MKLFCITYAAWWIFGASLFAGAGLALFLLAEPDLWARMHFERGFLRCIASVWALCGFVAWLAIRHGFRMEAELLS